MEDLRQAVDTAKRILTKEKIDRQVTGQSSSTPFMNIWGGYNSNKKVVTFDTRDQLDGKLDKITSMMRKFTADGKNQNWPFKLKYYQSKRKGQARSYYEQDIYIYIYIYIIYIYIYIYIYIGINQNSGDRRISYRGRAQYGQIYR